MACEASGKLAFAASGRAELPTVGDWVAISVRGAEKKATIHALIPRKSAFSRKVAGNATSEQVISANIDTVFIVTGLDSNFNLRRIERYLAVAWNSGAVPVLLLNKSDICEDADTRRREVESISPGIDVHTLSAVNRIGLQVFDKYLKIGKTVAFLGSSGVGKSTIINSLLGA